MAENPVYRGYDPSFFAWWTANNARSLKARYGLTLELPANGLPCKLLSESAAGCYLLSSGLCERKRPQPEARVNAAVLPGPGVEQRTGL